MAPIPVLEQSLCLIEQDMIPEKAKLEIIPEEGMETAGMKIVPFHTPHDARESIGFHIDTYDGRRAAAAVRLWQQTWGICRKG